MMSKTEDLEELKEIITNEVHKAVQSATSDLSLVFFQAFSKLGTINDSPLPKCRSHNPICSAPTRNKPLGHAIGVPKTKNTNKNTKSKSSDSRTTKETETISLMTESSASASSSDTTCDESTVTSLSSRRPIQDSSTSGSAGVKLTSYPEEERRLKRSKIKMGPPEENYECGLWCYKRRKQSWVLMSKYGRNVCRRCLAPVHLQRKRVTPCGRQGKQWERFVVSFDKSTNTSTSSKGWSRIPKPVSVNEVCKEKGKGSGSQDCGVQANCNAPNLFLTANSKGVTAATQTEVGYCSLSTQTPSVIPRASHHWAQTLGQTDKPLRHTQENAFHFSPKPLSTNDSKSLLTTFSKHRLI